MFFGERLKQVRERRGWSQRDLARNAAVDHAWISRLESGERHNIQLDAAAKLATALGVSMDYLAGLTKKRRPIIAEDDETEEGA